MCYGSCPQKTSGTGDSIGRQPFTELELSVGAQLINREVVWTATRLAYGRIPAKAREQEEVLYTVHNATVGIHL